MTYLLIDIVIYELYKYKILNSDFQHFINKNNYNKKKEVFPWYSQSFGKLYNKVLGLNFIIFNVKKILQKYLTCVL